MLGINPMTQTPAIRTMKVMIPHEIAATISPKDGTFEFNGNSYRLVVPDTAIIFEPNKQTLDEFASEHENFKIEALSSSGRMGGIAATLNEKWENNKLFFEFEGRRIDKTACRHVDEVSHQASNSPGIPKEVPKSLTSTNTPAATARDHTTKTATVAAGGNQVSGSRTLVRYPDGVITMQGNEFRLWGENSNSYFDPMMDSLSDFLSKNPLKLHARVEGVESNTALELFMDDWKNGRRHLDDGIEQFDFKSCPQLVTVTRGNPKAAALRPDPTAAKAQHSENLNASSIGNPIKSTSSDPLTRSYQDRTKTENLDLDINGAFHYLGCKMRINLGLGQGPYQPDKHGDLGKILLKHPNFALEVVGNHPGKAANNFMKKWNNNELSLTCNGKTVDWKKINKPKTETSESTLRGHTPRKEMTDAEALQMPGKFTASQIGDRVPKAHKQRTFKLNKSGEGIFRGFQFKLLNTKGEPFNPGQHSLASFLGEKFTFEVRSNSGDKPLSDDKAVSIAMDQAANDFALLWQYGGLAIKHNNVEVDIDKIAKYRELAKAEAASLDLLVRDENLYSID